MRSPVVVGSSADGGKLRPYATDRGGVQPEPWHLSFSPVSAPALRAMTPALLAEALQHEAIEGLDAVTQQLATIHERYVVRVDAPPPLLDA